MSSSNSENERISALENLVAKLTSRLEQLEKKYNALRDEYEDYLEKQAEEDLKGRITSLEEAFYEQGDLPERDVYGERIQKLEKCVFANIDKELNSQFLQIIGTSDFDKIRYLIENGADVNTKTENGNTQLHYVAKNNNIDIVKLLIEHGADVNTRNDHEETPLTWACIDNRSEIVKLLVENGADVNTKDNCGFTPLDYATQYSDKSTITYLKAHGAK